MRSLSPHSSREPPSRADDDARRRRAPRREVATRWRRGEVVRERARRRWDTCPRTCAGAVTRATVVVTRATGEAGDNPRAGATIAARGTTVEEAVRRRGAVVAREMRTVIEDRSVVGAVDEAVGAWRRCLRSGRRARAWRR